MTTPTGPASAAPRSSILDHPAVARVRAALAAMDVTRAPGSAPEPLLVLASGAHRVDTAKVAGLLDGVHGVHGVHGVDGVDGLALAGAAFVLETTGFVIGGVAPVGHRHPVRTIVDVTLARHDTVWAAAGHPNAVFATTYDELLRITGGQPIEAT